MAIYYFFVAYLAVQFIRVVPIENYTGLVLESQNKSVHILKFKDDILQAQFLEKLGIRSSPAVNEEISIDQNTSLTVNYDKVIIIRRVK